MSTLKVDTLQTTGGAGLYPAKAWVNFDGTGTVAIRSDGNVSSITDNSAGHYTVNFSSAMTDANYAAPITAQDTGPYLARPSLDLTNQTSSSLPLNTWSHNTVNTDFTSIQASITR